MPVMANDLWLTVIIHHKITRSHTFFWYRAAEKDEIPGSRKYCLQEKVKKKVCT
jgi:hypothetical protein